MSDSLSDITDLSELSPSTTTISTVAVQSGRSKVVLAILRGAEWIRVRVHQMEPDLMDVGSTIEEALQYQREHNEMLAKLKAKEDEVKKILCSADSYVTENPSQADVYSAMADTLSEAWRELNKKLEARSLILEQSVEFHKSAHEFSSKMEQAQGKFSTSVPTHDVETARHLLQQHQEIKTGILEASKSTLNQGHILLTRIREMGMHADLQNRHATTAACYGIEHLLELLQDRRRRLEDIWEQRRIRLEQCFQLCQLDMEVNKVLDWYRTVGSTYLQKSELGESYHQVQLLQEDHNRFETQAKHIQQTVVRLVRDADQLLRRANMDAEGVRRRLQTVDRECEDFRNKLDTRRKNIQMAASFFDQAETALTKLDQVEVQLNSMDLPRNSAALADGHAQLSNAIVEVSTQALREGRILLERVSRDDPGADGVRRRMTLLQERCASLESLCKARRAEAWERSQAYLQFQEHFNSLQTWLTSIGQATLSQHADMGTRLETAEDFLEIHEQLEQDLRDKNAELEALFEAGVSLVKSGDQEAQTAAGKVDTLHKQMQRLHRIVEVRIQLSLVYLSFHKLVQQLSTSMSGLEHIMTSETENLQDLTDQAMRHTEEMYTKLSELYNEVQEKGKAFFQNTSTVTDDSTLNVKDSVLTVERTITEYSERMTYIKTVWESWQQKVSTSRQFKSQWHQFVQDARKTIDRVMKTENEFFFPNIAGYLGNSTTSAEELQKKIDDFTPEFKSAIEELDKHLSTAELMEMKGDTKGQKDMIVNELVKVRQRFQARIHEYRILIKMTIQFFRNLDQLDKLIEKTEKEYTQSELPSDLSQAECMLEEHKRKQKEVSSLINFTSGEGEKIVVRVRQTDAEAAAQEDVERVLNVTAEYKQRWNQAWEDQEKRLKQNLQICQFNYDLRQIHSEIDDLHHHLQARRGSYGNSLPAARMTSQAFKQFEMTVQLIEKKISMFTSTAQVMVQDQHYDAVHIGREIDLLKTKWSTFHTSVGNYRMLLDVSITYFTLIEESEQWIREGNTLLINISRRTPECRNPEEVETLARSLNTFMETGKPRQDDRLKHISELAVELYGDEGPTKVHHLFVSNQDLMSSAQQMDSEIAKLHENLTKAQMAPVQEDVVPMEVTVTASAAVAKQPPRITLHLKDAEVMEGEKVTLQCQVQSQLPPEVTWFKDNLPLNSPDYETKFDLGCATLTIEETFSEDTARYTCRFTNEVGVAESSSYLHVRETHQQIIPPDFTRNLKSVDVLESGSFAFECHVTGIPSPTISWYKDDINIDSSPEYVITKINGTCCLKMRKVFRSHNARYTCRANNPGGEASSSARLTVIPLEKPVIHSMSEDVNIPEGKSVKLEIIFSGSPTPEVTWYRNDDRISPSSVYKITIELNRSVLEITEAYTEDSGTYKVTLQNTAGETHRSCQVNVENFYSSAAEEMSIASLEAEPQKPSFVQPLAPAREVMEGSRVRLDCVITGHPEPEVIWFRKDKPVKESKDIQLLFEGDRCTLSIREAYLEDSGHYRCVARNQHGEAESVCKLHVEPLSELSDASCGEVAAPKFTQLLRDLSIPIGHRVCLQCRVTGHPVPDIHWYKDNKLIENSPDYQVTAFADVHNLTIPETFEEDTGNYMVRATNLVGEAKCYAKLSVKAPTQPIQEAEVMRIRRVVETKESNMIVKRDDGLEQSPPEFQKLFQDMTVNAGDNVTFQCEITGSPKPKVTWYFNGEPVVSRDYQISMEKNAYRLHIPEVFDEDAGRFSITAENPSGKATCSACLNVDEEPTIPKTRIFGNTEMLSKRVSRTETTMTETHVKHIFESTQPDTYIPSYESHSTTILTDVSDAEPVPKVGATEHYATTIKTDMPPTFKPVDLTIAVPIPPKFLQPLKNITAAEGSKVVFEGVVSGKPEPTIKWFREGKQLTDKADFEIGYRDGRVSLTIPEVFEEDTGRFECQADNEGGQATSSSQLVVRATMIPPMFTEKLKIMETREGKAVRFTVRVSGQPPPTVTWYREGTQIVSSRDFEIITEGDLHTLYIPEVFQEDGGNFTVTAENPAGHAQCTTELRILAPMDQAPAPVQPLTEVRETFDQRRAPPREAPKPFEPTEEPSAKVPKLQRPSQFVARPEPKPKMFSEQVEVQVESKPPALAPVEMRIPLFKVPQQEDVPPPLPASKPPTFVTTKEKPVFTQMLKNVSVCEGERVVFECRISAHPEPIIKWFRETVVISSSPDYEITWENNTARLTIAEIFPEDAGVFKCVATNAEGSATSEARLQVKPSSPEPSVPISEEPVQQSMAPKRDEKLPTAAIPPQFTDKPGNSRLVEATNTIFECHVTGVPFPEITWKKRGFPIRTDTRHRMTVDTLSGRCSLTISHCRPDDSGEYTCTAVNPAGQDTVTATLLPAEVKAPSPPPPPIPSIPVAPLKSWQPVSAEPRETYVPVQEPVTRKPWEPVQVQKQQPVSAPQKTWEPPMSELRARMEAPQRHPQEFVVTRAEKILESNLQYRQSKEPEEKRPPPAHEFQSVGFEQRLMSENYMRDGHIKISSETETSEYESELQDDRGPPAPPASPAIIQKLKDFRLIEGSDATFVCRVTGRPRPKIAWYKNGHRIKRSNRYEMKYTKDGYCTLRIRIALPEDAGHFTILAVNASGKATCSSMLYVDSVGQIDSTSFVAPTTLEKMASKDKLKSQKPEDQSGILEALVRPTFKKVPESLQAREGQTVRLDTVVSGRPAPELTWYRDGQPVRNDNNHKTVVNEDGVNSLIILSATRYDAGTYMCVAKSKAGENSFNVIVSILEKEMLQPPKFINRMPNVTAKSGEPITLSCEVTGTPTPMISWQKDGKMLVPSNPYRIDIEGNRSTLYIEHCEPADSAWFQCSAINVAGSASTRAKVHVPAEMPKPEPVRKFTVPKVSTPPQVAPKPSQVVPKVAPQEQAKAPARMPGSQSPPPPTTPSAPKPSQQTYNRPFPRVPPPTPASTSVESSPVVKRRKIVTKTHITPSHPPMVPVVAPTAAAPPTTEEPMEEEETVLPQNVADAKRRFETPEKSLPPVGKPPKAPMKHVASPKPVAPQRPSSVKRDEVPPVRVQPPTQSPVRHVEAPRPKEPSRSPARQDVLPIPPGVPGAYDIQSEGPVQMITYVSDTEAGYLRLVSEDELDSSRSRSVSMERPRLPKPKPRSLAVLSSTEEEFERYDDKPKREPEIPASLQTKYKQFRPVKPPQQRKKKKSKTPSPPKEQPTPVVPQMAPQPPQMAPQPPKQAPVPTYAPQVVPKPPQVAMYEPRVEDHESAVREYIRREGEAPATEDIYDKSKPKKPWFKTQIKNLMNLKENDSAHFECKLLPLGDPTMEVEWYKDGQPLHHGHRYKPMHDFGFVCLDILYTYPEDSGEYSCIARNSQGEATSSAVLRCRGRRSIIMDTQLPGEGAMRLQEMEEYWRSNMYLEERILEEPRERIPPSIDLKPEPVETGEGEVAKFMIKVSGYPRPRVNWWVNGTVIMGSTRFKLRYDGMIHHLEIPRVREYDGGQIRVVAKNTEGEAEASTTLHVVPKEDWRSRLRQAPKGELEIELERRRKIEMRSVELVTAMEKPKATTIELKQIERAAEKRVVMRQEKEVMNAEQLYMSVHSKPTMRELPARVVRADRPEIQVDIQKARMVPVIPEPSVPDESKISETQIILERREPPVFTKPLRPVRVTEGKPVTLEVHFKGYPPPIISWYRDSFEIKPSHDFQISVSETVSTLFIPEVFPEDTGMYMVKAYNMYGTVQCKAKMTVIEEESPERDVPPEFRSLIRDSNVLQGEPATFDCQVSGRPKPKIHWQKDGKTLSESPRWKFIEEDNNFTMVIYEVTPEDVGQYDCVAINTVGKATCTARLNVEVPIKPPETEEQTMAEAPVEPPVVTEKPQNLEVDEGEPVTFTSRITGSPAPNVTWHRNNVIIKPSKYFRMESTPDGTHSLSILEAFPEDTGTYRCVARNKAGEVTCSATLKVHALESEAEAPVPAQKDSPPSFAKPISNTLVVEGSPATFEAEYSGTPEPNITWLRNSLQVLQDSTNYKIERTSTKTILTIREARPEDSGLITCRIKNIAGITECSAELYVQDTEEARLLEEKYITTIKTTPPEFVKALSPVQDVQPGGTARLYAHINAYPPPKYQWYTKGVQIVPSERRQMVQEDNAIVLIIINVQEEDSGDYILKVENEMGEVTCRTTLTVRGKTQYVSMPPADTETLTIKETTTMVTREERYITEMKPEILEPLEPEIYVKERGIARLQCKVDSYPPPLVTWFVNGMEIRPSPHYEMTTEEGNSVLLIIEVGPEDTGEYTCRAVSELGEVMSSTTLYVQEPVTKEMPAVPKKPEETISLEPSPSEELTPPRFVEVLPSMETYDGEEVTVPCKVVGKPPPQVSFFHNGKNIDHDEEYVVSYNPDTGDIHLLIVEVFPEDEGEYVCVASNPAGEASTRAYLTVLSPEDSVDAAPPMETDVVPQFIDRPKPEPLVKAEPPVSPPPVKPVRKEVTEVEKPEEPMEEALEEVTEQMTKPEKIEREKKVPLKPERVPESPERTVKVTMEMKPAPKPEETRSEVSEATLTPQAVSRKFEIPEVERKPVDEEVSKEDSVVGEEKPPQKEEVVSQFTLEEAQEVTEIPPEFVELLQPQMIPDGEEVTMTCRVEGTPFPTVTWYRERQEITPSADFKITQDETTGVCTLYIPEVFPEDAGEYACRAVNPFGEAVTTATLLIHTMPEEPEKEEVTEIEEKYVTKIEKSPEFVRPLNPVLDVEEDQTARLEVEVIGEPRPKVTWYVNEIRLMPSPRIQILDERTTSTLVITKVVPSDSQDYICVAENDRGVVTCKTTLHVTPKKKVEFDLPREERPKQSRQETVKYPLSEDETGPSASEDELPEEMRIPPVFTELLQPKIVRDGERVEFLVHFRGTPQPKVKWFHDGHELKPSTDFQISVNFKTGESSLVIVEVFPEDEGEYTCSARNRYGETITTCRLTVVAPEEDIPEHESHRMTIEVQQVPKPEEVTHDIHTTKLHIQKEPQQEVPLDVTEETRFKESIELDHHAPTRQQPQQVTVVSQPAVTHPVSLVTQQGTMVTTEPTTQFEIQIGFPQQQQPQTTSSVTTETTTITTTKTTEEIIDVDDYPKVVDGGEFHKTSMVVTSQEEPQPLKLIEIQTRPTEDVVSETTRIITKEIRDIPQEEPEVSESEERHSETIEIVHDVQPQEVQFEVSLPEKTVSKTEKTFTTQTQQERRTSVQKYEVEIQEKFMVQKPHEIHIPLKSKSEVDFDVVDGAEPKDLPRPSEEQIEEIRPSFEVEKKPEPVVEEDIPKEEKPTQETTIEFPVEETPVEEVPVKDEPVKEEPTQETPEETPVEDTTVEVVEMTIPVTEETKQEVETFITESEVQKTEIIESEQTHLEEVTFDLQGQPKEEVTFSIDIQQDKPVEDVTETKEETHQEEITFQISEQPEDVVVEEVTTTEETHTEEITFDIKGKPLEEVTFSISTTEETTPKEVEALEEKVPEEQVFEVEIDAPTQPVITTERETIQVTQLEAETPAPLQPVEVTERAVIEHVKEPESETVAPEDFLEISQRETIEIIREPEEPEEVIQIDIDISEQLPEVTSITETEETRSVKEVTFELPQVEDSYQEEMVINVENQPKEEVQLTLQIEQTEQSAPEVEEVIRDVEVVKEEIKETIHLPEVEETHKEEITLQVEDTPDEAVELTLHISDSTVSEIEETRTTEKSENIEEEFVFQLPSTTDTKEEVMLEVEDKPSEEIVMMTVTDQEKEVPESDATVPVEQVSMETTEVFQLPVLQQEEEKEVVMDTEETPGEEIQFSIDLSTDSGPFVLEEVTQRRTSRTEEITTTQEVSTADDTTTEEITLQIEDIPEEEYEMTIQLGDEAETNLVEEVTTTDEVSEESQSFTFQLAEIEESTPEETSIQVEETPGEEVELTLQISDDQETAQVQEAQESETITNTTEEITFQVSDLGDTTTEEVTFQLTEQPQEEVELTLQMPEHVKEVTKIVVTEEHTKEEKITVPEATTTREVFPDIEIPDGDLAPDFTWGLTSLKVMDGEEAKFRCEVEGHPMPEISWYHDDKPITENQDFKLTYNTESGACTLLIVEVFPQDAGEYTCVALNKYGKAITRGYLEVESYEYVPDTEEASDSFLSSIEAASPKPHIDSDSELSTVAKEFEEQIQKVKEKMEIEILEAKEEPAQQQEVEIQAGTVETAEVEETEEVAPITQEPQPEEAKPLDVTPEAVQPTAVAPVESVTETTHEVVTASEEVVLIPQELQPEETTSQDVEAEAVQPTATSPIESVTETTQEDQPSAEVVPITQEVQSEKTEPTEVAVEAVQPKAVSPVETIAETTQEEIPEQEDVVPITQEPQPEETKPTEVTPEDVQPTATSPVESVTDTTQDDVPSTEVVPVTEEPIPEEAKSTEVTPEDVLPTATSPVESVTDTTQDEVPSTEVVPVTEEPIPEEAKTTEVTIEAVQPTSVSPVQSVADTTQEEVPTTEDVVPVTEEPLQDSKPTEVTIESVQPRATSPVESVIESTQDEVAPEDVVPVVEEPELEETKPVEVTTESVITTQIESIESVTKPTEDDVEVVEVSEVVAPQEEVPVVITPLTDMQVAEGTTVKFEVSFTGTPTPEVVWFLENEELKPTQAIEITTQGHDSVLVLHEVFPEDEGQYFVEVTNPVGKATTTAYLHVSELVKPAEKQEAPTQEAPTQEITDITEVTEVITTTIKEDDVPTFVSQLNDMHVTEHTTIRFDVTYTGEPEKVIWSLDGEEIEPCKEMEIVTKEHHSVLLFHDVIPEDEGEYTVEVITDKGTIKSTAYLHVHEVTKKPVQPSTAPTAEESIQPEETEEVTAVTEETSTSIDIISEVSTAVVETRKESLVPTTEESLPEEETGSLDSTPTEEPKTSDIEDVGVTPSKEAPTETETAPAEECLPEEETEVVESIQPEEPKTSDIEDVGATPSKEEPKETSTAPAEDTVTPEDVSVVTEVTEEQSTPVDVEVIEIKPTETTVEQTKVTLQVETVEKSEVSEVEIPVTQETTPVEIEFQVSKATSETIVTKTEIVKEATQTVEVEMVPEVKPETETTVEVQEVSLEVVKKVETLETEEVQSPRFTTSLTDITIMENNVLHLEVVFTARPAPTVTWFLDGEALKSSEDIEITTTETTSAFIIKDAYPEDEGEYWVEVSNKAGTARSTAYICILPLEEKKPVQTVEKTIEVTQEEVVTVGLEVSEKVIQTKTVEEVSTVEIEVKKETQETVVQAVITEDSQAPKVEEGVTEAPRFIQTLQRQVNVLEGSTVTVECIVAGTPTPEVMWFQDDEELRPDAHYKTEYQTGVCRLTIQDIYLDDEAIYKCEATNEHGVAKTTIEIFVENYANAAECVTLHEENYEIEIEMEIHWKKRTCQNQIAKPISEKTSEPLTDQMTDHMVITRPDEPWDITVRQAHRTHSV